MTRPIFGKTKTIVLPIPSITMTLEEYKNQFGIDLNEIYDISLSFNAINAVLRQSGQILFRAKEDDFPTVFTSILNPVNYSGSAEWISGSQDATLILGYVTLDANQDISGGLGMGFSISKDAAFDISNLRVGPYEF